MKNDKVTIKIPRPLYAKIQQLVADSGFNSATDFIVYVLRDLVSEAGREDKERLSSDEIATIKKRLKNLGYL